MENYAEMCARCTHKSFCYKWAEAHKEKAGHCRGEYFEEDILASYDKEWVKILLKADKEARLIVVAEEFGDEKAKEITETVRKALEKKGYRVSNSATKETPLWIEILKYLGSLALKLAVFFCFVALMWWAVCFGFGLTFTWKFSFGIWAVVMLGRSIFYVGMEQAGRKEHGNERQ